MRWLAVGAQDNFPWLLRVYGEIPAKKWGDTEIAERGCQCL